MRENRVNLELTIKCSKNMLMKKEKEENELTE